VAALVETGLFSGLLEGGDDEMDEEEWSQDEVEVEFCRDSESEEA
jgi:hypothetical protein